ncbi:MAG TPA: N-acetylmuramoyl-L-alanine amidase, partial [Saprospiraceae bacterium]|nr:N-acetylmuramoyl-L-alanine amidase [Saprospiraceae bacterium]
MRNYHFYGILFLCLATFNVNLTAKSTFSRAKVKKINIFDPMWKEFSNSKIEKIVIDAGHGGRDGGTSGQLTAEKDLTLKIALLLGKAIAAQFPEIEILYTRKTDVYVPLAKRARIANDAHADLFISIHCNAMPAGVVGRKIHGSETYVLGAAKKERNLVIAKRENEALFLDQHQDEYGFSDPESPEWHIFMSMYQQNYLDRSIQFAERVEKKFKSYTQRKSRGVLQANFHVLREVAMPSVLIETGYLSNSGDEKYLASEAGQEQIAQSIADAFYEYKMSVETDKPVFFNSAPASVVLAEKDIPKPIIKRKIKKTAPKQHPVSKKVSTAMAASPTKSKKTAELSQAVMSLPSESTYESIRPVTQIAGPKILSVSEGERHEKNDSPQESNPVAPKKATTAPSPVGVGPVKKQIID